MLKLKTFMKSNKQSFILSINYSYQKMLGEVFHTSHLSQTLSSVPTFLNFQICATTSDLGCLCILSCGTINNLILKTFKKVTY